MRRLYGRTVQVLTVFMVALLSILAVTPRAALAEGTTAEAPVQAQADAPYNLENLSYTLTSLDGETLSTTASGRPKLLIFVNATGCPNSSSTVSSLAKNMPAGVDIYVAAFSNFTSEEVSTFATTYGSSDMKFAANGGEAGWAYINATLDPSSVTTPIIVYIDENNLVQYATQGAQTATNIRKNLVTYCGMTLDDDPQSSTTEVLVSVTHKQTESRSMLDDINAFRTGSDAWYWNSDDSTKTTLSGLSELTYDYGLEEVAMQRAAEIAVSYSHTRPNGSRSFSAYDDLGYGQPSTCGENIAAGSTSASSVFELWQESSENYAGQGHRRNMLNGKFKYVGVACVVRNGTYYWVQEFSATPTGKSSTTADDSSSTATVEVLDSAVTVSSMSTNPASISLEPVFSQPLVSQKSTGSFHMSA